MVDRLREFYKLAGDTLFPGNMAIKNTNIVINRKDNISLFFSKFYDFYNTMYPVIRPICGTEIQENSTAPISYRLNKNITRNTYLNSGKTFSQEAGDNIIIVGAGPIGLYLAGILKACAPHLEVNIIEKRASEDKQRALTRTGKLVLRSAYVYNKYSALDKMNELFSKACPILQELLIGIDPDSKKASLILLNNIRSDIFKLMPSHEKMYGINQLELLLGNFAQRYGVNIYHDNSIDTLEVIESKYVNKNTKYLIDATGGRLMRNPNINGRFHNTRVVEGKYEEVLNRKAQAGTVGPYIVKEGYLRPDQAVYERNGYIYATIGETFIKVDYQESKSVCFGAAMSLGLVLIILRELLDTKKGGKRKTRKLRR